MIQLTTEEKNFINVKLKPLLKKDNWDKIRQECRDNLNILGFFAENGLDVFSGLSKIPDNMFFQNNLSKVIIPKEIKVVGENAFEWCKELLSVTFESGVEEIESNAFAGTGIAQVSLPDTLVKLNTGAFRHCANLKKVTIPDSITNLPNKLFEGCNDDIEIYAHSRKDLPKNQKLRCPKDEIDWYVKHLKVLEM